MISIICCSNNLTTYKEMLLKSLETQDTEYEIILVDNTEGKFRSAASALNYGALNAKGDYLAFIHQDIYFSDSNFLNNLINYIKQLNGIVGVAGILNSEGVITNLRQGNDEDLGGEVQLENPVKVQTLDEVLIACHRLVFHKVKFDEETCDDWHLYGVDFCLTAKELGIDSYVIPDVIFHKSSGKISLGYALSFRKVIKKHRDSFEKIYTTCAVSSTKRLRSTQYIIGLIWDHFIKVKMREICQKVF